MTAAELRAEVLAKCSANVLAQYAEDRVLAPVLAAVNVGRTRIASRPIGERGVVQHLGVEAGEACLAALETFAEETLPELHPLKSKHAGIKRMLAWLKTTEGLDIGTPEAVQLLGALATAGVLQAAWATQLIALATVPNPVDETTLARALWSDDGELLI